MIFDSSGFFVDEGLTPNTMALVIAYMAMATALGLYMQFGLSFLYKGIKSESTWQKTYYRGLGAFFAAVAISQFLYIADLLVRDVYDRRIFLTNNLHDPAFYSFVDADYFVVIYSMVLISLALLMHPVEKYLYAQKRKPLTIFVSITVPMPLILRMIEINHVNLGIQIGKDYIDAQRIVLDSNSYYPFHYQVMTGIWFVVIGILAISALYLLKLYLDLGRKSPPGSKLRKKSRMIVFGLLLWLVSIFLTSTIMKEISDAKSSYLPGVDNPPGSIDAFMSQSGLFWLLPFVIPTLLLLSLTLMIVGFTRDYE
jgi:hypothetical protein